MQTELVTELGRYKRPPQPDRSIEARPVRRVGALDLAAMHLGVALIKWSRRPLRVDDRERLLMNREVDQTRRNAEQERDQIQALYLTRLR